MAENSNKYLKDEKIKYEGKININQDKSHRNNEIFLTHHSCKNQQV